MKEKINKGLDRRQFLGALGALALNACAPAVEFDPRISLTLKNIILQFHNSISELAFNNNLTVTGGVAGTKQINDCYFRADTSFYNQNDKLGCDQATIARYMECSQSFPEVNLLRRPAKFTFGFGRTITQLSKQGFAQRSYLEDFIMQMHDACLYFYTNYGIGFEVDLNSKDCVMFTTQVENFSHFDRSIKTKNSGFSFEPEFDLHLNDMSFYRALASQLYEY